MPTIPNNGALDLDFRTKLVIVPHDGQVSMAIEELSLGDGLSHSYGPVVRSTKEAALLDLLVFLQESGEELTVSASQQLEDLGKYAAQRLCQSLSEPKGEAA